MQLDDQLAELQVDLERIRRRIEAEGLKAVDHMREYDQEIRGIWSRLERIRAAQLPSDEQRKART